MNAVAKISQHGPGFIGRRVARHGAQRDDAESGDQGGLQTGIKANLPQFLWLVLGTVLVGMTVGIERTIVPLLGKNVYHVNSTMLIFTFIIAFGVTKAALNLVAGRMADALGRRPVLIAGWLFGVPMIALLLFVHTWSAVIVANVFLGANQAFSWTMTVTKQVDLAGASERGLAMGINEATGYIGVSLSTVLTGVIAARSGLLQAPFIYGAVVLAAGLGVSVLAVRETQGHVRQEAGQEVAQGTTRGDGPVAGSTAQARSGRWTAPDGSGQGGVQPGVGRIFWDTTVGNATLSAISQAGMANKLADTLVWALLPIYLEEMRTPIAMIGWIAGAYAMAWGLAQFGTGLLSDRIGRKPPIVVGMAMLGLGILAFGLGRTAVWWTVSALVMGLGMALLYPNLNAAVADVAPPRTRASVLGVYRLWRDGGYAVGGLLLGVTTRSMGMQGSLFLVGGIVLISAGVLVVRMEETHPRARTVSNMQEG